jgi:RNA polymerase sigma-70 factor, ECF subfamily
LPGSSAAWIDFCYADPTDPDQSVVGDDPVAIPMRIWTLMRKAKALSRLADEELMRLVGRKDAAAFELFYDRHGAVAYSLAYRIVGDRAAAEDVTQEAFLSIWRSEAGYDPTRGSVRGWTLGIVRHRAIDALRRRAALPPAAFEHEMESLLEEPAAIRTEAEVLRRESARELRGALGELPTEQSEVIELAYFGGFSQSEIAEMLAIPLGTVKGRMRLGLEKGRMALTEGVL